MPDAVTRATPSSALPFALLLDVLRSRGMAIGLHDYVSLGRLLSHYDDTSPATLRAALAALLAKDAREQQLVRDVFDELFGDMLHDPASTGEEAPTVPEPAPRERRSKARPRRTLTRLHARLITATIALATCTVLALGYAVARPVPLPPLPTRPAVPIDQSLTPPRLAPVEAPLPQPPTVPTPPTVVAWRDTWAIAAVTLAVLTLLGVFVRTRALRHQFRRGAWRRVLAALPGPQFYRLALREGTWLVPRHVVDEVASILARRYEESRTGQHLDIGESVRRTLRAGLFPQLVFEPPCRTRPVIVLQDIGRDMRPWTATIDRFLGDLERQGIPLNRFYFDQDATAIAATPFGAPIVLRSLGKSEDDASLLVVSTGAGVREALEREAGTSWLNALSQWPFRAWLTPVTSQRHWRAELQAVPARVWPMTPDGLHGAARDLAGVTAWGRAALGEADADARPVTSEEIERMKRLVALAPAPVNSDLAEALRARFCPDISRDVILHLLAASDDASPDGIVLPAAEAAQLVRAFSHDAPSRVANVQRFLLHTLERSEPVHGSVAHLRWQTDRALLRVQLAEQAGEHAAPELERLADLAVGPLGDEVATRAAGVPVGEAVGRRLRTLQYLVGPAVRSAEAGPGGPQGARREPVVAMPAPGHLVLAALGALISVAIVYAAGGVAVNPMEHEADAFRLEWRPDPAAASPGDEPTRGQLAMAVARPELNGGARLFRNDVAVGEVLALPDDGTPVVREMVRDELGFWYQIRAELPAGNLALSEPVWVPGAPPADDSESVTVSIDAMPWASIRLVNLASGAEVAVPSPALTPLVMSLPQGDYLLELENGGVTAGTQERISVRPGAANAFRIRMPLFDPNQVVAATARGQGGATQ